MNRLVIIIIGFLLFLSLLTFFIISTILTSHEWNKKAHIEGKGDCIIKDKMQCPCGNTQYLVQIKEEYYNTPCIEEENYKEDQTVYCYIDVKKGLVQFGKYPTPGFYICLFLSIFSFIITCPMGIFLSLLSVVWLRQWKRREVIVYEELK